MISDMQIPTFQHAENNYASENKVQTYPACLYCIDILELLNKYSSFRQKNNGMQYFECVFSLVDNVRIKCPYSLRKALLVSI